MARPYFGQALINFFLGGTKKEKLSLDIYSLGVTFCQMLYEDKAALNKDAGSFERELLISMTQQQPGMRPSIDQVIRWLEQELAKA